MSVYRWVAGYTKWRCPQVNKYKLGTELSNFMCIVPCIVIQLCSVHNSFRLPDCLHEYRVSQEECEILRESVPYVKLYRYNPKHLYTKLNGYGDNGQRNLKL